MYFALMIDCQGDTLVLEMWSVSVDVRYVLT